MCSRFSSRLAEASISRRTCSASAGGSLPARATDRLRPCSVSASIASRWPRSSVLSASPSARRACLEPGQRRRRSAAAWPRRAPRAASSVSMASGTSSTPRSASSPSALAGATPNCSCSRLRQAGEVLQEGFVDDRLRLRSGGAADRQRRLEIAARKSLLDGLPHRRLQPLEARRQPQPHLDALAVDRLDFPGDRRAVMFGDGAREAGHALQCHVLHVPCRSLRGILPSNADAPAVIC